MRLERKKKKAGLKNMTGTENWVWRVWDTGFAMRDAPALMN